MDQPSSGQFKPNIYPIMYWALAFGATAGVLLFLLNVLSQFIAIAWFPVFLAGLIWGGYRNYQKQKKQWQVSAGAVTTSQSPVNEFRQAFSDIAQASRDVFNQDAALDEEAPAATADTPDQTPTPPAPPPPIV